ncbi:MAG: class D sortase [Caloramator sp.]|nr:class D sortase [Caloramator sp.]
MKKLGIFLISLGISILVFTGVVQYIAYRERQALIETVKGVKSTVIANDLVKNDSKKDNKYNAKNPIGVLEIPKIDLIIPIVEGETEESLKNAAGHIEGTGPLGADSSNYCIAGHRAHYTGGFFHRLDELEVGDEIKIKTKDGEYYFKVIEKKIVTPDKVEVLNPTKGKALVTLITCHPLYSNKKRLIVVAELKK